MVTKRNEALVPFDKEKIINAVNKAFVAVDGKPNDLSKEIAESFNPDWDFTVEQIQDMVEAYLMDSDRKDVARAYVRHRYKREAAREHKDVFFKAIGEKLRGVGIENSNANMDENSFSGRIGTASDLMNKMYALEYCLSPMAKANHLGNRIYIHDLSAYASGMHNCLSAPIDKLLANGFKIRQTDIRPAGSVNTAMQLIAVIFQLQSLCQFGGISSTHVDYSLAPYVRKSFIKHYETGLKYVEAKDIDFKPSEDMSILDERYKKYHKAYDYAMDMTKREIHQGAEALYHNLNSLQSRSGGQLPFSSLNYGTCTLEEGRMVTRALLEVSIEGLGKFHKTSIFPCGIFKLAKGVNRKPGDPNYDLFQLALKSTAQRLYPNYANVDWSGNVGYDPNKPETEFSTMGLVVLSSCKTS